MKSLTLIAIFIFVAAFSACRSPEANISNSTQSATPRAASPTPPAATPEQKGPRQVAGYEKYTPLETAGFRQNMTPFIKQPLKDETFSESITCYYVYKDGRDNATIALRIEKYASETRAKAEFLKKFASARPAAEVGRLAVPTCKSGAVNDPLPPAIVKRIPQANGSELVVVHRSKFYTPDCKLSEDLSEFIYWTEGQHVYTIDALPKIRTPEASGRGVAVEFLSQYGKLIGLSS